MRILFLLPAFWLAGNSPHMIFTSACQADTTIVTHLLDGNINEWPAEKFMTDKATKMTYAVDNNNETLFLAINLADQTLQKRIMQEGLNLYIDTKGKKKENRGIEFPMKMGNLASIEYMKLFGFAPGEPVMQSIRNEGTINIAIAWDTSFVMHIEYNIPLKIVEETVADLKNKKISIGWNVTESATPAVTTPTVTNTTTRLVGVPAGTRPPTSNRSVTNVNNNPALQSTSNKSQSVWTSHTITF